MFEFVYFLARITTALCRRRGVDDQEYTYDRSDRKWSDDDPLDPRHKQSMNEIRFTLTPAQSAEDLHSPETEDYGHEPLEKTDSLHERLDAVRNSVGHVGAN